MIDGCAVVDFDGTGNILVAGGIRKDGRGITCFSVNDLGVGQGNIPKESSLDFSDSITKSIVNGEVVQLLFENTSSIDIIIQHLEALKFEMESQDG